MTLMVEDVNIGVFLYLTSLCVLNSLSSMIVKPIIALITVAPANEKSLISEIQSLKAELKTIPMKDQFATYARLQRKISKLEDELTESKNKRAAKNFSIKTGITLGFEGALGLLMLISCLWFGREPILKLKPNFGPMLSFLNFTMQEDNVISAHLWIILSCFTLRRIIKPLLI